MTTKNDVLTAAALERGRRRPLNKWSVLPDRDAPYAEQVIAVEMERSDWDFVVKSLRYLEYRISNLTTHDRAAFIAEFIDDMVNV